MQLIIAFVYEYRDKIVPNGNTLHHHRIDWDCSSCILTIGRPQHAEIESWILVLDPFESLNNIKLSNTSVACNCSISFVALLASRTLTEL
jgi:hypothetical protein